MSFSGILIKQRSAVVDGDSLRYTIHIPWYRSLPLSAVTDVQVAVDGVRIPRDRTRLAVNGGTYALDDLAERWWDVWFVQDEAEVLVPAPAAGVDTVDVRTTVLLRSPYIMIGPDTPLVATSTATARFDLAPMGATR